MTNQVRAFLCAFLCSTFAAAAPKITPFELPWMNHSSPGTIYKSSEHPNSVFVIETYFLGCPYCNDNAPNVDELADEYKDMPLVQVLDVGIDSSDSQYQSWISKHSPNHPVLKDPKGSKLAASQLGTTGYPSTYVLDCRLKVLTKTTGVWDSKKKQSLKNAITQALETQCTDGVPAKN